MIDEIKSEYEYFIMKIKLYLPILYNISVQSSMFQLKPGNIIII